MSTATSATVKPSAPGASGQSAAAGRVWNFSAGPGQLPEEVLRQCQQDIWNVAGTGMGVMEHSHRAPWYDRVLAEAEADCREVGSIPKNYRVLFMTGGASAQNWYVPANLLPDKRTADYMNTGYWAQKTIEDAKFYEKSYGATIHECSSSKGSNYTFIPGAAETTFSANPAYVHYTSNNTIYGTQFHAIPAVPKGVPLVCDMCSDIFSRPVDISKFGLIYAGAQKNLGPSGITVVIIRDDLVEAGRKDIHPWHQYRTFATTESRPNTPPVLPVYVVGQMFKWIKRQGGLKAMEKHNAEKAKVLYDVLDASAFYKGHARADCRSLMNVTFRTPTPALDEKFVTEAAAAGLENLRGHRATGGMRASVYNAMPKAGAEALAAFMREFERKNG